MSSGFAWITSAVPPFVNTEFAPSPIVTRGSATVTFAVPFAFTVKFGMSPLCGPLRIIQPVVLHVGIEVAALAW